VARFRLNSCFEQQYRVGEIPESQSFQALVERIRQVLEWVFLAELIFLRIERGTVTAIRVSSTKVGESVSAQYRACEGGMGMLEILDFMGMLEILDFMGMLEILDFMGMLEILECLKYWIKFR